MSQQRVIRTVATGRQQDAFDRFKVVTDVPMTLLAFVLGLLLAAPMVFDLSSAAESSLDMVGWMIWGVFVFEYLMLLWLAPDRWKMVRTHPIELILIAVPVLRPLRVLRVLRAVIGLGVAVRSLERMFGRPGFQWFLAFATAVVLLGGAGALAFERQHADAEITTLADAIWWAVVTSTTVGYGDYYPVSGGGRAVAVVLMLLGVSVVSVVTANVASFMVGQESRPELDELEIQIQQLHEKIDRLLDAQGTS